MARPPHRRNRLASWYESTTHPELALVALVFLLYAPSFPGDFVLDDLRNLRLCREYSQGLRPSLDLYRFLPGGEENRTRREQGWYPWWVEDGLRYTHFRPLTERFLYGEYLLFGEHALGYRVVGVSLYALGVVLVLALFRFISGSEKLSRWGAVIFSVAACHSIPVTFISAQCDLIALLLTLGVMLLTGSFILRGGPWRLVLCWGLYGVGLLAKEAVLPVAAWPLCLWLKLRREPRAGRRSALVAVGQASVGIAWLAFYVAQGYGSNAVPMLDPIHAPADFLSVLPSRAVLLLSTWLIPVSPFLFQFHHDWVHWLGVYAWVGGFALAAVLVVYWRSGHRDSGVRTLSLWVLPFIPLLACTVPDDRVMMLPSIGLAYFGAVWLTWPRRDGSPRLRRFPLILFIVVQAGIVPATFGIMQFMEFEAQRHLRHAIAAFGREVGPGDCVFFLNTARNFEGLLTQDRLCHVRRACDVHVCVLSDVARPKIRVVNDRTLRLEAQDAPFFSSFVGMMGSHRDRQRQPGDVTSSVGVRARIAEVREGEVVAIELQFQKPLTSDAYRFFWSDADRPPEPWRP